MSPPRGYGTPEYSHRIDSRARGQPLFLPELVPGSGDTPVLPQTFLRGPRAAPMPPRLHHSPPSCSSAWWSVATRKWCRGPALARYSPSKALPISAGGGEASVRSRSHGSAPGSCLPTAPGQTVARRAGRSLQRTLAIESRHGCSLLAPHWRETTTTWVVRGSAVGYSATRPSESTAVPRRAVKACPPTPRIVTQPQRTRRGFILRLLWGLGEYVSVPMPAPQVSAR